MRNDVIMYRREFLRTALAASVASLPTAAAWSRPLSGKIK